MRQTVQELLARRWITILVVVLVVTGWLVWLDDPELMDETRVVHADSTAPIAPIGRDAYAERLRRAAGLALTPETLGELAATELASLDTRMNAVARRLGVTSGWRQAVTERLLDHPADAASVLDLYRLEVARAEAFVRASGCFPLPAGTAPVEVVEIHNPQFRRFFSLAMYLEGRLAVTASPVEPDADDSYLRNHCSTCVPPLAVHETWPGHHVAFAFAGDDAGRPTDPDRVVFHEGWGLYAEQTMLDLGYYADDPARELGALRFLYLRALRAQIDPALHEGRTTAAEAEERYRRDGLLTAAAARAEVARHWKDPVLKASYFIGLRQILALRRQLGVDADDPAALAAFHERFLGTPRPIPDVALERFGVVFDTEAFLLGTDDPSVE